MIDKENCSHLWLQWMHHDHAVKCLVCGAEIPPEWPGWDEWEPSEKDIQWLQGLMDKLKVGGIWIAPSYNVIFKKIDEGTLEIQQPLIVTPQGIKMIDRTMKVGNRAGITVKRLDAAIIIPYPMKTDDEK